MLSMKTLHQIWTKQVIGYPTITLQVVQWAGFCYWQQTTLIVTISEFGKPTPQCKNVRFTPDGLIRFFENGVCTGEIQADPVGSFHQSPEWYTMRKGWKFIISDYA